MPKAVAIFQSPSSPGSGAASVDVRTNANPRPNGGTTVVQPSLGTHVSDVGTRAEIAAGNGHARQFQSFESWPLELDGDLLMDGRPPCNVIWTSGLGLKSTGTFVELVLDSFAAFCGVK